MDEYSMKRVEPGIWQYDGPRGSSWYIAYRDAQGRARRERVHVTSLQGARNARTQARAAAINGTVQPRARQRRMTLADYAGPNGSYWQKYLTDESPHLRPSTKRERRQYLRLYLLPRFGRTPLVRITRRDGRDLIAGMVGQKRHAYSPWNPNPNRPTYARKTLVKIGSFFSTLLQAAVDDEVVPQNPLRDIKWSSVARGARPPKAKRLFDLDEFRRSLDELAGHPDILRMVLVTALGGGPNWAEGIAIDMRNVDFPRHLYAVQEQIIGRELSPTKTASRVRWIRMSPIVEAVFRTVPWREGYAFSRDGVTRIGSGTWIRRQWKRAQVRADIREPLTWHDLRHLFVSLCYQAGVPERRVAQEVGHRDSQITHKIYEHFFTLDLPQNHVDFPEDLLWPEGWRSSSVLRAALEIRAPRPRTIRAEGRKSDAKLMQNAVTNCEDA